jgi:hypothetical protein
MDKEELNNQLNELWLLLLLSVGMC